MKIEVSVGEIVDKFTILTIKSEQIQDEDKLKNVTKELGYLLGKVLELGIDLEDELVTTLLDINKELWKVEDDIRNLEREKFFGHSFVKLARNVYILNDKRADIKKKINIAYSSEFIEEKSYNTY